MATPAPPAADARIGAKIEYFAKYVAARLKPLGFVRKSRTLHRDRGTGAERCVQLISFPGHKANEGSCGRFTVDLGVRFPALLEIQKDLPGMEWVAVHGDPYRAEMAAAGFSGRLNDSVPVTRDQRWPAGLDHSTDYWASIDHDTDLIGLAEGLVVAITEHGLPWLDQRSTLAAFRVPGNRAIGHPSAREHLLASVLEGDIAYAREQLITTPAHRLAIDAAHFDALVSLLRQHGVDAGNRSWVEPAPLAYEVRRQAKVDALKSAHGAQVEAYLRSQDASPRLDDAFLDAWVHEDAANQLTAALQDYKLWPVAKSMPLAQRRALLIRMLRRMPEPGPTVESTVANVWASYENYHVSALSSLAVALLKLDDQACDAEYARELLQALASCTSLVREGMSGDEFRPPVSDAIHWLDRSCSWETLNAVRPDLKKLLDGISQEARARSHRNLSRAPERDILGDRFADHVAALFSPESRAKFDRLYQECPERAFAAVDRDALLKLKRWLRAQPDGHVPLAIELDDWGRELTEALAELSTDMKPRVLALLEWFDADVSSKPSKRWWAELDSRVRELPVESLSDWLARTLPRFAASDLEHFLGAPGYLGFPGETSGRALLGLVHLAGRLDTPALVPALATVAEAAFKMIPEQRMRALSVGNACLAPLARQEAGRARLEALRDKMKQKSVRAAIDKALASGLGRYA